MEIVSPLVPMQDQSTYLCSSRSTISLRPVVSVIPTRVRPLCVLLGLCFLFVLVFPPFREILFIPFLAVLFTLPLLLFLLLPLLGLPLPLPLSCLPLPLSGLPLVLSSARPSICLINT